MEEFENVFVSYMFKQAAMPFFMVCGYSCKWGSEMTERCQDFHDTWKKAASRVERGMRVPNTWRKKLAESKFLVESMAEANLLPEQWVKEHFRAHRFIEQYKG
jgi:hypothetical protein